MFLDATPEYTNTEISFKKHNSIIKEFLIKKNRSIANYSTTPIFNDYSKNSNKSSYSPNLNSIIPAPKKLKKSMFKMSSRGIGKILNNA